MTMNWRLRMLGQRRREEEEKEVDGRANSKVYTYRSRRGGRRARSILGRR
uniref:Uncharacterized protein n=1 Tax=Arundo donax TaxID=35708 RepID=A0A0A9AG01_ARUDO